MRVEHIRAQRSQPGLRPQHLTAVHAAAAVCQAQLTGAALGSQTLTFVPGAPVQAGRYTFDVQQSAGQGSAGSTMLVLQTVLLPLALAAGGASELVLRGGTHVPSAPPASYVRLVFLPTLARMGIVAHLEIVRWGFYPAGGGEVHVTIQGLDRQGLDRQRMDRATLQPLVLLERGERGRVWGEAVATNLPAHIPQRMASRAGNLLKEWGMPAAVTPLRLTSTGPGAGCFLFAEYECAVAGSTALGRPGLPSEEVAEAACRDLLAFDAGGAAVDRFLADQLVLPMALAGGTSRVQAAEITSHLLTNVWTVRQFLPVQIEVVGQQGEPGELSVSGGYDD